MRGSGRIGYVPQTFPVDATLPVTVAELLALSRQRLPVCLGALAGDAADGRAARSIASGLAGLEGRRLGALSGGELRRVLLAQAMDPPPELLLLDEPGERPRPGQRGAPRGDRARAARRARDHGPHGLARPRSGPPPRRRGDLDRPHRARRRPAGRGAPARRGRARRDGPALRVAGDARGRGAPARRAPLPLRRARPPRRAPARAAARRDEPPRGGAAARVLQHRARAGGAHRAHPRPARAASRSARPTRGIFGFCLCVGDRSWSTSSAARGCRRTR